VELRKTILRLLLGSLALAAAAGVLAVLLPIDEVMLRVSLSGVTTAVAAGLLMLFSLLIDRERFRPAGLFGSAVVVLEFLVAMVLIWLGFLLSWRVEEELGLTMGLLALAGIPITGYLLLVRSAAGRIAGFVGTATATLMFIAFMLATWLPGGVWSYDEWWGTGWAFGCFGLLASASLVDVGTKPRRWWRRAGVVAAAASTGLVLIAIWDRLKFDEEIITFTTSVACVSAYANIILRISLPSGQAWVAIASVGTAAVTGGAVDLALLLDGSFVEDFLWRVAAAGGIVTGCGTMAVVVLMALNRRTIATTRAAPDKEMIVVCPACGKRQRVPVGKSSCVGCRLHFDIRIAEPRCRVCDYQLSKITSDVCPECGTPIDE
jgi:hypothetical protein